MQTQARRTSREPKRNDFKRCFKYGIAQICELRGRFMRVVSTLKPFVFRRLDPPE
jgi:hypothetical protein